MRVFGYEIAIRKAARTLSPVDGGDRGWSTIFDTGVDPTFAFQQDFAVVNDRKAFANWAVFACATLIASDIAKLRVALYQQIDKVWQETVSDYDALLRKPNHFQTWQQFVEQWQLSKQRCGNAYVLLERDKATRVRAMYVLNPDLVQTMVAEVSGDVYYKLDADALVGVGEQVFVPASEVIHDRMNCLFHPLVGLSPLYASALAATQGMAIQEQSITLFKNGQRPGGLLTSPQVVPDDMARKYKERWETNFGGANRGKTAVLGNGLTYSPIAQNAVDSELVAQLKLSAEMVCSTFHVPAYKVGVGATPTYQNAEILNQIYYDSCLQQNLEAMEALIGAALELDNVGGRKLRCQFDVDGLLRMDSATQTKNLAERVKSAIVSPNEARAKLGYGPVKGGESPYLQQQNYSLEALAKRDAGDDPFGGKAGPAAPAAAANEDDAAEPTAADQAQAKGAAAEVFA